MFFVDPNPDMTENIAYDSIAAIRQGTAYQIRQIELQPCSAYEAVGKGDT